MKRNKLSFLLIFNSFKMKRNNNNRKRKRKRNIDKKKPQLPHELITEILSRLPVKSLVRFKCVCKSWFSLISDSHFATSHFNFTAASRTHSHRLVLITNHTHQAQSIDVEASLYDDTAIASLNLDFLLPRAYLEINIGGSARGFLFLYCDEHIYLWNPSTGVHKQIPRSPIVSNEDNNDCVTYLYGFGYDPSTDDYLVVLGSYDPTPTDDGLTHFEFFSLRANIWKEIEGAPLPYIHPDGFPIVGTLLNGAIHWLAFRDDISMIVIVSFDLTERRISEIAIPDRFESHDLAFCDLWVFRGFMSLWAMQDDEVEIWVMEEHGVSSSWSRTFVLSMDEELGVNFYPICSTNYGGIVGFNASSALVKYNYNDELLEHRDYGNDGFQEYNDNEELLEHRDYCNDGFQVAFYTESLLSLPLPRDTQQA